jgi:UDPglucose 6-dehydrogenase
MPTSRTQAAREIAATVDGFTVVIAKSTVPVGTCDEIQRIIHQERPQADVAVVSNPEFLREGAAIRDFKFPDRIVVGCNDERARNVLADVYRPLSLNQVSMLYTSRRNAELIEYASNAFLATKITFINEMADLCERVGADIQEVASGIRLDNRIGSKFLHAGPGFGGSCFPKDVRALIKAGQDHDIPLRILEAVATVNDNRKRAMARKVSAMFSGRRRGKTVGVLGLSFKPNTDDMREAPSLALITALFDMGANVRAFDPVGMGQARTLIPQVAYCESAYDCADGVDALVIVTEWEQFRALDFERLRDLMATPVIIDLRNIYRPEEVHRHGFAYASVGRSSDYPTAEKPVDLAPPASGNSVLGFKSPQGIPRSSSPRRFRDRPGSFKCRWLRIQELTAGHSSPARQKLKYNSAGRRTGRSQA